MTKELQNFVAIFAAVFILLIIMGILAVCIRVANKSKQIYKGYGKIIEKPLNLQGIVMSYQVMVEFENGTRARFVVYDKNIMITAGDVGFITYQGNTLLGFEKAQLKK